MKVTLLIDPGIDAHTRRVIRAAHLATTLREAATGLRLDPLARITVKLSTDEVLRTLNAQFLSEDHPTDVLSFPSDVPPYVGDIAISVQRAIQQSQGKPADELRLLAIHGLLHCLGHDHMEPADAAEMTRLTRECLPDQEIPDLEPAPTGAGGG